MKPLLLLPVFFLSISLAAQEKNQACYHDTTLVDQQITRFDTTYVVKEKFRKGDWEIFYDFQFSKKYADYQFDKNGEKTGTWTEWYENGKLKSNLDYSNSWFPAFPAGQFYYPNGTMKIARAVERDSLIETSYFTSGKISKIRKWTKGGLLVIESAWCENGQLALSYNPTSSIPLPVKKYHCNGNVKTEYNWYVYGYTGAYTEYFENGKVSVKGQFQELPAGATVFMARKTGTWTYYDDKGKVVKTEDWSAGKLIK